ncbi:hypothetical protein BN1708_009792 [Verticillium longisporum]|uniref:DUF1682 domain protein n=1 Tax=Verticillium longisporum TaxID=100787 RepID=A0A0G4KLN1_VERLO|nr:hypothetical protein BN1708_009792 [Verticillium longisporum]
MWSRLDIPHPPQAQAQAQAKAQDTLANVLNSFFGGGKAADKAVPAADSDFADFAEAPNPVPTDTVVPVGANAVDGTAAAEATSVQFTRWYRVDQRHSLDEFRLEGIVISIGLVIFIVHLIGSRLNRSKSKAWARAHAPALKSEFASVGFSGRSTVESDPQAIEGSAEITEQLLTPEIIQAVELAGDAFDYLIVSDQPIDKPRTLEEATTARKRIFLRYTIPSSNDFSTVTPLFTQFLQLPDSLVAKAKFRPEILRKVNRVREEAVAQLKKEADAVVAEERNAERERVKKVKRDQELAGLDAKQQKRYLEKEREKETRKAAKKQTMRG